MPPNTITVKVDIVNLAPVLSVAYAARDVLAHAEVILETGDSVEPVEIAAMCRVPMVDLAVLRGALLTLSAIEDVPDVLPLEGGGEG